MERLGCIGLEFNRFDAVALLALFGDVHALDHLTKDRVAAVQMGVCPERDVKLGVGRIGVTRASHGHSPLDVAP